MSFKKTKEYRVIAAGLLCSGLLVAQAHAADDPLCMPINPLPSWFEQLPNDGKTHMQADSIQLKENRDSVFSGNVIMSRDNEHLAADLANYSKSGETLDVSGNVRFTNRQYLIEALAGHFDLKNNTAILKQSEYQSMQNRMRGAAEEIHIRDTQHVDINQASYTTCDKGNDDWLLKADSIRLDQSSRQGSARGVVIEFKGIPIFYLPYLRFPIGDERLTGLLFPSFGHSERHGDELQLPFYWNIAPNYDATITPWWMSERGTLFNTEFRYLGNTMKGQMDAEYLPNDKLAGIDRERLRWVHNSDDKQGWRTSADVNYVADNNHLVDFNNDLYNASTSHLIRTGSVSYNSRAWQFSTQVTDYQTLNGDIPYQRMPQINFNTDRLQQYNTLNYQLNAEYVRFDHETPGMVIGERLELQPSISYPYQTSAGFFTPKLTWHSTTYQLEQTPGDTLLQRDLPVFSLNSGLFFERETSIGNSPYLQTLEPQLFYVYVPYRSQDALPVFDSSAYPFNFNQPFSAYRFNGIDRIGDDNRITAALATRFINQKDGSERFMARIGQVFYMDDRQVQLSALTPVETHTESHIIAELNASSSDWSLGNQYQWDPELEQTVISSTTLRYRYHDAFRIAMGHRYQLDTLETRELELDWQMSPGWKFMTRHLYSLRDEHNLQTTVGLDYESCCWGLRLTAEQRLIPGSNEQEDAWYLELVLKGLAGFGKSRR